MLAQEIPDIFSVHGEMFFRNTEREVLGKLTDIKDRTVIATGGGMCKNSDNIALMRARGTVIFLNPGFDVSYERIKGSDRPMVVGRSRDELHGLYLERLEGYRAAAHLEIAEGSSAYNVEKILRSL